MIDKPGTLLIVRKKERVGRHEPLPLFAATPESWGIDNIFKPKTEKPAPTNVGIYWEPYVRLPYGACVLLLSLKTAEHTEMGTPNTNKNIKRMEILYNEQTLVGILSSNQCNKWFTYPGTWKRHYEKPAPAEATTEEDGESLEISTTSMAENNSP